MCVTLAIQCMLSVGSFPQSEEVVDDNGRVRRRAVFSDDEDEEDDGGSDPSDDGGDSEAEGESDEEFGSESGIGFTEDDDEDDKDDEDEEDEDMFSEEDGTDEEEMDVEDNEGSDGEDSDEAGHGRSLVDISMLPSLFCFFHSVHCLRRIPCSSLEVVLLYLDQSIVEERDTSWRPSLIISSASWTNGKPLLSFRIYAASMCLVLEAVLSEIAYAERFTRNCFACVKCHIWSITHMSSFYFHLH